MLASILLYAGSIIITLWGVAHIVPTKSIVAGFEPLSVDNRRVLTMDWVSEGLVLTRVAKEEPLVCALGDGHSYEV